MRARPGLASHQHREHLCRHHGTEADSSMETGFSEAGSRVWDLAILADHDYGATICRTSSSSSSSSSLVASDSSADVAGVAAALVALRKRALYPVADLLHARSTDSDHKSAQTPAALRIARRRMPDLACRASTRLKLQRTQKESTWSACGYHRRQRRDVQRGWLGPSHAAVAPVQRPRPNRTSLLHGQLAQGPAEYRQSTGWNGPEAYCEVWTAPRLQYCTCTRLGFDQVLAKGQQMTHVG